MGRVVLWCVVWCVWGCVPAGAPCVGVRGSGDVPEGVLRVVARAVEVVNGSGGGGAGSVTVGGDGRELGWATGGGGRWSGGVLSVPGGGGYLAVFYRWHTCQSGGDHVHRVERVGDGWRIGAEIPEGDPGGFRVRAHDLRLRVEPVAGRVEVTDRLRVERVEGGARRGLLRLSSDFVVRAVRVGDAGGAVVPFAQVGGVVAFVAPAGRVFTLYVEYGGRVRHEGSDFVLGEEAVLNSYWYAHTGRLPATARVRVTVPGGWRAVTTGDPVGERVEGDGWRTFEYWNGVPVCYYSVAAGRYAVWSREVGGRRLSVWLRGGDGDLAGRCLELLGRALRFFEERFGAYPYSGYTLVGVGGPFSGALEGYSFAMFGGGSLPGSVVHEVAHTWWGGLVPCRYVVSMWNEGFAEYSAGLFARLVGGGRVGPGEARARVLERDRVAYGGVRLGEARDTMDGAHVAVGYGKGAGVLRALEGELGVEGMLRCMREFVRGHVRGEAAEWGDFAGVVRRVTGRDYGWFFDQWLERRGVPRLRVEGLRGVRSGAGWEVVGVVVQEGEPYRLRLPVEVVCAGGARVRSEVVCAGVRTGLRVVAGCAPRRLRVDPEGVLPLWMPGGGEWDVGL
ncbi:MAG: M1 family aminopeptidase [Chloroherpetonaceae bacterium]|nr:M1 family aminopeptidase [Chloroherpetonaceae bacterium]